MAAFQVLALDTGTPDRVRAPGASDTYLLPRLCYTTTGEFTSDVSPSGSSKAFHFNTSSTHKNTSGAQLLRISDNGTEELAVIANSTTTILRGRQSGTNIIRLQAGSVATSGYIEINDFLGAGGLTVLNIPNLFTFYSVVNDSGGAQTGQGFAVTGTLNNAASNITAFYGPSNTYWTKVRRDGSLLSTGGIGLWSTTAPSAQYSTSGEATGFTAVGGTTVQHQSTFTGNSGTKAYTINDIVKCLKAYGLMATS